MEMDLNFRSWIAKRATLHEYFFQSRSMFQAARSTSNSSLAARLTGESIELAIKALLVLAGKEPSGHRIGDCLDEIPELKGLMANLWGRDFDFMVQMVDEDINTSQMRYGAAGSYVDKKTQLIAAAAAKKARTWTDEISELYEELMSSLGAGIWENYPEEDTEKEKAAKRIRMYPIFNNESPGKGAYPDFPKSLYGFVLQPTVNDIETEYFAIIPIDRLPSRGSENYWVRVRIDKETAVDQQVITTRTGLKLPSLRWIGRPVDGVKLSLYEARSRIQPH